MDSPHPLSVHSLAQSVDIAGCQTRIIPSIHEESTAKECLATVDVKVAEPTHYLAFALPVSILLWSSESISIGPGVVGTLPIGPHVGGGHDRKRLEFDSMINLRPSFGNSSRGVEDPHIQKRIKELVQQLVRR